MYGLLIAKNLSIIFNEWKSFSFTLGENVHARAYEKYLAKSVKSATTAAAIE